MLECMGKVLYWEHAEHVWGERSEVIDECLSIQRTRSFPLLVKFLPNTGRTTFRKKNSNDKMTQM